MRTLDLQRIRKDFNVTQKALADMLNINQSFLSNIENGRSPLPYDKRQKILEVFNITRPEEYTIEIPEPYSIKNVQRSWQQQVHEQQFGGVTFHSKRSPQDA